MVSYPYAAPSGVPGDITRVDETNVEPAFLVSPFPSNYGTAMKYATGSGPAPASVGTGVTPMVAADVASSFCGILARSAPSISNSSSNEVIGTTVPNQSEVQNLVVRGYVNVFVNAGTPVRGQPVYIVQTASGGHPAGAFETTANAGNNIPLSDTEVGNVTWAADGVDAFGNAEVRIAQ
jgi:hypothetical protein